MKKMNSKGFTLIELLAVITIMGILMMVAIPSVSRTIENSRRDTFANIAHEYINAVRNGVLADNIECFPNATYNASGELTAYGDGVVASATADGTYYFQINTEDQNTKDLMESGGKSPFGNAEMKGYIKWVKTSTPNSRGDLKTKTKYTMVLTDSGKHGFTTELEEASIKRSNVNTNTGTLADEKPASTSTVTPVLCKLS